MNVDISFSSPRLPLLEISGTRINTLTNTPNPLDSIFNFPSTRSQSQGWHYNTLPQNNTLVFPRSRRRRMNIYPRNEPISFLNRNRTTRNRYNRSRILIQAINEILGNESTSNTNNLTNRVLEVSLNQCNSYKQVLSEEGKETIKKEIYDASLHDEKRCPISCTEFKNGDEISVLPCKHIFFPEFISEWLEKEKAECPICRYKLKSKEEKKELEDLDFSNNTVEQNRQRTYSRYVLRPTRNTSINDEDIELQRAILRSIQLENGAEEEPTNEPMINNFMEENTQEQTTPLLLPPIALEPNNEELFNSFFSQTWNNAIENSIQNQLSDLEDEIDDYINNDDVDEFSDNFSSLDEDDFDEIFFSENSSSNERDEDTIDEVSETVNDLIENVEIDIIVSNVLDIIVKKILDDLLDYNYSDEVYEDIVCEELI